MDPSEVTATFFDSNPTNPSTNGDAKKSSKSDSSIISRSPFYYDMSGNKIMVIFNHYQYKKSRHFRTNGDAKKSSKSDSSIISRSPFYYDMSGNKIMVIFNHYQYKKSRHFRHHPTTREGTHYDVKALKNVFQTFSFKITTCTDYDHSQIIDVMKHVAYEDHSRTSCLVVVILTHGDTGGEICAADRPYPLRDLVRILEHGDKGLVNKPKLFFVQACRGNRTDDGRKVQTDGGVQSTMLVPSHIDFLVMQSSVDDYLSWRGSDGSWMIQELCEVLKAHYQTLDLLQMITLANQNVAYKRVSSTRDMDTHNKKQTMETRFTLTKFVKF